MLKTKTNIYIVLPYTPSTWFIKHSYAFYDVNLTPALKVNLHNCIQYTCLTGGRERGTPHFLTRWTHGV